MPSDDTDPDTVSAPALVAPTAPRGKRTRIQATTVIKMVLVLALTTCSVNLIASDRYYAMVSDASQKKPTPLLLTNSQLRGAIEANRNSSTGVDGKRFAYMFYVTKDIYGCAALHLMHNLAQTVHMDTSRIDLVVLHSRGVSQHMLDNIQAAVPVRLIPVDSIRADTSDPTWVESLTKLNAFRDWGYDRVVYMDADGVPLKNLDHLFDLPLNVLYSPTAYWLKQPFFMSAMLVIEPSEEMFEKMIQWARERGAAAGYDMDILNSYFADTVIMLPGDYTVLNSDFRAKPDAANKLYSTTTELKVNTQFVHFSCRPDGAYGKPWTAQSHDLRVYKKPAYDPLFAELYEAFWKTEKELCA